MDKVEFLRKTPLFAGCSKRNIKAIASMTRTLDFKAGDEVIEEGSQSTVGFYMLLEGTMKATRGDRHLADYHAGDYFGEIALLLDDMTRTATVSATSDATVLAISRWDFKALLQLNPEIAVEVMGVLAQRLADTDRVLGN